MVIKIKDYTNISFTQISNDVIRDNNISLNAKGLLIYMLSCTNDWNFSLKALCQNTNSSRRIIENAIHELESAGYVKRGQYREKGRFGQSSTTVSEIPDLNDDLPFDTN